MKLKTILLSYLCAFFTIQLHGAHSGNLDKSISEIRNVLISEVTINALREMSELRDFYGPFISDKYAVAGVLYEPEGGSQLLLEKQNNKWSIIEGGGGSFTEQFLIDSLNVPPENAKEIWAKMEKYWRLRAELRKTQEELNKDIFKIKSLVLNENIVKDEYQKIVYGPFISNRTALAIFSSREIKIFSKKKNNQWIVLNESKKPVSKNFFIETLNVPEEDAEKIMKQQNKHWIEKPH